MIDAVASGAKRCGQCWKFRPIIEFLSKNGKRYVLWCIGCRARYGNWQSRTMADKRASQRAAPLTGNGYTVRLVLKSGNRKTGPIPVSMTDRRSCPSVCVFQGRGCYASYGKAGVHWSNVATAGVPWSDFCEQVKRIPRGRLWRHNEAGDLPGLGNELDIDALRELVEANVGRRGFTFTHKPLRMIEQQAAVRAANAMGFTINLSANNLSHADRLADLDVGPVVVVLPSDAPTELRTPAGRPVEVCINETTGERCLECGKCADPDRKEIIAFRAHGTARKMVSDLVKLRRKEEVAHV